MLARTKIALAAAVIIFAAAPAAQAGDNGGHEDRNGFHIGPLGQYFGGPFYRPFHHRSWGRGAYAYGAPRHSRRAWHYE